jgi:transcriptional regulator with XRE-family HTH domain
MCEEYCKNTEEIWKDIPGYEGFYQSSTFGRTRSFNTGVNRNQITTIILLINKNLSVIKIAKQTGISETHIANIRKNPQKYLNREKILKTGKYGIYGHLEITLCKNGVRKKHKVHRLILETFVGPCPPGMECRHLDGNPQNNRLDNLCWGTPKENQADRIVHGTDNRGSRHGSSKVNDKQVVDIKRLAEEGKFTQKEIGKMFNISQPSVSMIKNKKRWTYFDE